ncbi:hypothetical protein MTP99_004286 [Tenebrio molitor]|nr:hypothetical protein MTP99_004286 [Tenebrio molitor]
MSPAKVGPKNLQSVRQPLVRRRLREGKWRRMRLPLLISIVLLISSRIAARAGAIRFDFGGCVFCFVVPRS